MFPLGGTTSVKNSVATIWPTAEPNTDSPTRSHIEDWRLVQRPVLGHLVAEAPRLCDQVHAHVLVVRRLWAEPVKLTAEYVEAPEPSGVDLAEHVVDANLTGQRHVVEHPVELTEVLQKDFGLDVLGQQRCLGPDIDREVGQPHAEADRVYPPLDRVVVNAQL